MREDPNPLLLLDGGESRINPATPHVDESVTTLTMEKMCVRLLPMIVVPFRTFYGTGKTEGFEEALFLQVFQRSIHRNQVHGKGNSFVYFPR